MKDIKITMLGTSKAGKTCYMLAMYAKMSEGINGFTLSTKDPDRDLELIDQWEKLVEEEGEDRWPTPNDENFHSYSFNFNYSLTTRLMGFDWLDYRGGALRDSSTKKDVEELRQRLVTSSCVFLCISGEYLSEPSDASVSTKAGIRRMNQLIGEFGTSGEKVPVVIVITKYDLCRRRPKLEIVGDIKQLFGVFFEKGTGWPVMICPVTLGMDLENNLNSGLIVPVNVHLPLVFAIYSEVMKEAYEAQERLEQSRRRLEELQNRNVLVKFLDRLQGLNRVNSALGDVNNTEKKMNEILGKLNLLTRELTKSNIDLYFDGEEVESNV
jgi:GTPase SAR1 family protein